MDFFRTSSSPISRKRTEDSPEANEDEGNEPSSTERNQFSYYFMLRTGKCLDIAIAEQTKKFIFRVRASKEDVSVKSKEVQMFYAYMTNKIRNFPYFHEFSTEALDDIVVGMERFVMVNIYANVFNPPEDQPKNALIDEKLRSLHWILPKHLDFALPSDNELTDRQLALAQYYLLELNKKRSPHDKISCIVLCCKSLYDLFNVAHDKAAGADELLPMLIYTLIVASPVNLYSTTQYIDRFLPAEKLMSGETAYNFTNVCCAIQFLENLTPDKLSLSHGEFEHYMEGHSSHLEDALTQKFASGLLENIERVKKCEDKVKQLQSYHVKLKDNAERLHVDVQKHWTDVQSSIESARHQFKELDEEMAKLLNS